MTRLDEATIVRLRSTTFERTPQRLDPLGAQSAWMVVPLLGALAVGYAVYSTIHHSDQFRNPQPAIVAVVALALAVLVFALRTHPGLGPFGRWSHLSIMAVAVTAACLFSASVWGTNHRIQDDWGQIAVALLLIAMPLYRPVSEVAIVALVAAAVLGAMAMLQTHTLAIDTLPVVYFTVAATPVLALAFGGCGYAWTMTGETLAWRELARAGQARLEGELRASAQRMVAQERVTTLNEQAVPFLAEVLTRGAITADDRERARAIAADLRSGALGALERTWLAETLAQALAARGVDPRPGRAPAMVADPHRLDAAFSDEQRAIVGAVLVTIARLPGLDPASVRVVVSEPKHPQFVITADVQESAREVRRQLRPFLSALRSQSMDAFVRHRHGEMIVRFGYPEAEDR